MSKAPSITLGGTPRDGLRVALSGFDILDQWALSNDPMWIQLTRMANYLGLDEVDRLRLIAAAFAQDRARRRDDSQIPSIGKAETFVFPD